MQGVPPMKTHITALGVILLVFGFLGLMGACVVMFIGLGVPLVVLGIEGNAGGDAAVVSSVLSIVIVGIVAIIVLLSIPDLVAGYGLVTGKPWAWVWGLIACALELLWIPIGTLAGIYGLWVLTQPETQEILRRGED